MSKIHDLSHTELAGAHLSILNVKSAILIYSGLQTLAVVDEVSEFLGEDSDQYIAKLGLFYFTAIGQGGEYHQGLFGPLPVPNDKEHVSFVFASLVADKAQLDDRAAGQSYTLVCLLCPRSQVPKYMDRAAIEESLSNIMNPLKDVSEIKLKHESFVTSLKLAFLEGSS
ncbi:MAG: hypothetical protein ACXACI_09495 [Candidatus Hodarchaeales archaeon]|jgi:hypothetical protein